MSTKNLNLVFSVGWNAEVRKQFSGRVDDVLGFLKYLIRLSGQQLAIVVIFLAVWITVSQWNTFLVIVKMI
jgi:hypothetical protein